MRRGTRVGNGQYPIQKLIPESFKCNLIYTQLHSIVVTVWCAMKRSTWKKKTLRLQLLILPPVLISTCHKKSNSRSSNEHNLDSEPHFVVSFCTKFYSNINSRIDSQGAPLSLRANLDSQWTLSRACSQQMAFRSIHTVGVEVYIYAIQSHALKW